MTIFEMVFFKSVFSAFTLSFNIRTTNVVVVSLGDNCWELDSRLSCPPVFITHQINQIGCDQVSHRHCNECKSKLLIIL